MRVSLHFHDSVHSSSSGDVARILREELGALLVDSATGQSLVESRADAVLRHMNRMADALSIRNLGGTPIQFVTDVPKRRRKARKPVAVDAGFRVSLYDYRIWSAGEVATRPRHLHDICNFAVWCLFPGAKVALNARQIEAARRTSVVARGSAAGSSNRSPEQDAISILDEGGLVALMTPDGTRQGDRKIGQGTVCDWFVFGHALFEGGLTGLEGLRGMVLPVCPESSSGWPASRTERRQMADRRLSELIANPDELRTNHMYQSADLDYVARRIQTSEGSWQSFISATAPLAAPRL